MTYDQQQSGMEIHIGVRCQACDESYLNTLARTPERAKANAESMGWLCLIDDAVALGWVCPDCFAQIDQ